MAEPTKYGVAATEREEVFLDALTDIASGDWQRYPNRERHKQTTVQEYAAWVLDNAAGEYRLIEVKSRTCFGPDGKGCFIPHDCDGKCSWAPWSEVVA